MPHPLDPQIDPQTIDRYLAGEASPSDLDEFRAHQERDPAWAAAIDALRQQLTRDGADASRESRSWNATALMRAVAPSTLAASLISTNHATPGSRRPGK